MPSDDRIHFEESQAFSSWIAYGIMFFISVLSYVLASKGILLDWGNFLLLLLPSVILAAFFLFARLHTAVTSKGILVRLKPLMFKPRLIEWNEIAHAEVIHYRPLRDFGGYGIRIGKMGTAYNVSGRTGILIQRKKGKAIMIGTAQPEEFLKAVKSFVPKKVGS